MASTSQLIFVGRRGLLEKCRAAIDSGISIQLAGESGVGKTALARRIKSDAIYLAHVTPTKQMLINLLMECHRRGWYEAEGGAQLDEAATEKATKKLDIKALTRAAVKALEGEGAVIVLDNFDEATSIVVRACKELADVSTLIVCSRAPREAQRSFLFGLTPIPVPRLTPRESEDLVHRLLSQHNVPEREKTRVLRQLVEQSQGLPSIAHEVVKRAVARGDLSLRSIRQEQLSGHETVDMTPGLVIGACLLVAVRVAFRGGGDHDLTVIFGASGALFMLVRFYAGRLSSNRRR